MSEEKEKIMTFRERYDALPRIVSPKKEFVSHYANLVHRSESTMRMYLSGSRVPDILVKETIAKEIGEDVDVLFPEP